MNRVVKITPSHFDIGNKSASNILSISVVNSLNPLILLSEASVTLTNNLIITVADSVELKFGDIIEVKYVAVVNLAGFTFTFLGIPLPADVLNNTVNITAIFTESGWKIMFSPSIGAGINLSFIRSQDILNNAITTPKIQNEAVNSTKIADSSISTAKILTGAVTEDKVANLAITTTKIGNNAVTPEKLSNATAQKIVIIPKIFDFANQDNLSFMLSTIPLQLLFCVTTVTETAIGATNPGTYTIVGNTIGTLVTGTIIQNSLPGATAQAVIVNPGIIPANEVLTVDNTSLQTVGKICITLIYST
jgi:hypothetical protein